MIGSGAPIGHCGRWHLFHPMAELRRLADVACWLHLNLTLPDLRFVDSLIVA